MTAEAATAAAPPDPARSPARWHIPPGSAGAAGPQTAAPRYQRKDGTRCAMTGGRRPGDPRRNGDKQAWDALVERYSPLIWCICRRHRLGDADAEDVGQSVWLHLVTSWTRSAIRPRFPAGWPPRPGGSASGSCARRGDHCGRVRAGCRAPPG